MFRGKSLKFKLILSFCIVAVITLLVGFIGWSSVRSLDKYVNQIGNDNLPAIRGMNIMNEAIVAEMNAVRSYLLTGTDDEIAKRLAGAIETARERAEKGYNMYNDLEKTDKEKELWAKVVPVWNRYWEGMEKAEKMAQEYYKTKHQEDYDATFKYLMRDVIKDYYDARDTLKENINLNQELVEKNIKDATKTSTTAILLAVIAMIIGVVLSLTIGIVLSIAISKPINKIVDDLLKGAEQVAAASEQLSETSQQLAEGSSENAASIEETSSTISETSSMVQQNTENTREAAILSIDTKKSAEKENAEMGDMLNAMEDIKKSSSEISKIIKVIDDIAFQTNILSLNAAVEAARAGDAGAGFAVVAEEVRNLAQRSAQAAKDTATMIETSVERAATGVTIAKKVAESLNEITGKVEKVHAIMDEINVASQEQAQGISQINKAVSQMEQVTQSIAANAEESASASEELNAQAENMKEIVEDLIHIVSGDNDDRLKKSGNYKPVKKPVSKKIAEVKEHKSTVAYSGNKTKVTRPDDVIPLEDDVMDF